MQSKVLPLEEGKDPGPLNRTNQARPLPFRLLQLFVLFLVLCFVFSVVSLYTIRRFGIDSAVMTFKSNFLPCLEEYNFSLGQWIKAPVDLMHSMTDEELFWRASFSPHIKNYPFERVPKIAFMFLTKGPLPLSPLWERFLNGHQTLFSIYIHSLPSFKPNFSPASVFHGRQIPSQIAEWGRMSICDAEKRLLANALLDINNEWFILLSESCIPLYNFSVIYNYLKKSKYSFMGSFDDLGPYGRGRYKDAMAPEVNITEWRKGSQWFEVNRKLAINIVQDTKFYKKFKQFCRPPCYVDEHYFPTMLTIEAGNVIANRSLTWVDWSRGGPHPATFGGRDITEELLTRIVNGQNCSYNDGTSSICSLFARKFAPSTLQPLLRLALDMFGY
ncbi:glycosyltransferase BC10-like [Benincasa hispida]|uniref:glycosyltransferase BC10-like n=1 Tax=Benincasa hispida TaxID=102211 RepID=UPI0018FF77DE|nr:glycosyltransferase BC10-like [Benincasa hispida]